MCAFPTRNSSRDIDLTNRNDNRTRKQRIVKNGCIEVDNVTVSAGYLYSEWIRLSKEKLLEREGALMKIRIDKIQSIVNKQIEIYIGKISDKKTSSSKSNQYFVSDNTLSLVQNSIKTTIDSWNGIDLNKKISSKPYQKFREYFNVVCSVQLCESHHIYLLNNFLCIQSYLMVILH